MMAWLLALAMAALPDVDTPIPGGQESPDDAAVVVGLEDYVFLPDVPYATNDARAIEDFLVTTRGVPPQQVQSLSQAGREQILAAVTRAGEATGTVWIYLAGHGVAAPSSGERLFLGDDARQDPAAFEARGIPLSELQEAAGANGASVVLMVDACFNGKARDGGAVAEGTRFAVPVYVGDVKAGSALLSASGPDQLARPLDGAEHGAFTYALLGALRGWADGIIDGETDGRVTSSEVEVYVRRAMPDLGIDDQRPELRGDRELVLSTGSEPAPELDARLATPRAEAPPAPVPMPGFDPDLVATAAIYNHRLPLIRGPFGYKDADGEKVRRRTVEHMIRSTKQGRKGNRMVAGGITMTAVGFAAGMGFTMATLVAEDSRFAYPAAGGGVLGLGGVVLLVAGQATAQGSLDPH